jgi:hypothetical protein
MEQRPVASETPRQGQEIPRRVLAMAGVSGLDPARWEGIR